MSAVGNIGSFVRFIDGAWATDVGKAYRVASKANKPFQWAKAYGDYFIKEEVGNLTKEPMAKAVNDFLANNKDATVDVLTKKAEDVALNTIKEAQKNGATKFIPKTPSKSFTKELNGMINPFAKEAAANATAKAPGFFGKLFKGLGKIPGLKFIGKHLGPILIFGFMAKEVCDEVQNGGGLGGVLKVIGKGLLTQLGFAAGMFVAGALCATGIGAVVLPLVLGMAGSMAAGWLGDKVIGKTATQLAEENQTNNPDAMNMMFAQNNAGLNQHINNANIDTFKKNIDAMIKQNDEMCRKGLYN